jgi:hypothetical protein
VPWGPSQELVCDEELHCIRENWQQNHRRRLVKSCAPAEYQHDAICKIRHIAIENTEKQHDRNLGAADTGHPQQ